MYKLPTPNIHVYTRTTHTHNQSSTAGQWFFRYLIWLELRVNKIGHLLPPDLGVQRVHSKQGLLRCDECFSVAGDRNSFWIWTESLPPLKLSLPENRSLQNSSSLGPWGLTFMLQKYFFESKETQKRQSLVSSLVVRNSKGSAWGCWLKDVI